MHKQDQKGPKKGSLLAQETNFFFSLFSFDGLVFPRPKFCPKLNETLPPLYVQYVFESIVIAFKEAAKDNNHMSDEDV